MEIRSIICGYKLCFDWHCPLRNGGKCAKYDLSEGQIVRRFTHAMNVNPDFRRHVMDVYPEVCAKYYDGVQYE